VQTRLPVYISLALNYLQNKRIFSDNAKIIGRGAIFKRSSCRGAIAQKRLKTTDLLHAMAFMVLLLVG